MHDIIRSDFGGDRNTFIKTLEAQNFTMGEFKKMEMEKMIVQAMRSRNVKLDLVASPAKVEEYYKAHRDEFTSKGTGQTAPDHDPESRQRWRSGSAESNGPGNFQQAKSRR